MHLLLFLALAACSTGRAFGEPSTQKDGLSAGTTGAPQENTHAFTKGTNLPGEVGEKTAEHSRDDSLNTTTIDDMGKTPNSMKEDLNGATQSLLSNTKEDTEFMKTESKDPTNTVPGNKKEMTVILLSTIQPNKGSTEGSISISPVIEEISETSESHRETKHEGDKQQTTTAKTKSEEEVTEQMPTPLAVLGGPVSGVTDSGTPNKVTPQTQVTEPTTPMSAPESPEGLQTTSSVASLTTKGSTPSAVTVAPTIATTAPTIATTAQPILTTTTPPRTTTTAGPTVPTKPPAGSTAPPSIATTTLKGGKSNNTSPSTKKPGNSASIIELNMLLLCITILVKTFD